MSIKQAKATLEYFGRERNRANTSSTDWMPDRKSREEIAEAVEVIKTSRRSANEILNREGYSLFEKETQE